MKGRPRARKPGAEVKWIRSRERTVQYYLAAADAEDYLEFGEGSNRTRYILPSHEAVQLAHDIFTTVTEAIGISHVYRCLAADLIHQISRLRIDSPPRGSDPE